MITYIEGNIYDSPAQVITQEQAQTGEPYLWENDQMQILNFPTKQHWRGKAKLEYIESGLKCLAKNYSEWGIYTLAMPPLGCGNGGLYWTDVRNLLDKYLASIEDLEVFAFLPTNP